MTDYTLLMNQANAEQILEHLKKCDKSFVPSLSSYVNPEAYSLKLYELAQRIEAWNENDLIGLVALYTNTSDKTAFITNCSLIDEWVGYGIAKAMIKKSIKFLNSLKILTISLEVFQVNKRAIGFYLKQGFKEVKRDSDLLTLQMTIVK